jgi:DNA end-binding protein Ku
VKPDEIKLARQVIGTFEKPLDLATYKDEYREGLQEIINAKIAGQEIIAPPSIEAPPKVVNLMDALRQSLDKVSATKKKPAKAVAEKAVPKRKRA